MPISPPIFHGTYPGIVPQSDNSTTKFLRGDGQFQVPAGGGGGSTQVLNVVSGAAPIDVGISEAIPFTLVNVTSGGTGGNEFINLPRFTYDANNQNFDAYNFQVIIQLLTQTNPADVIQLTSNSNTNIQVSPFSIYETGNFDNVHLGYAGALAVFFWSGYDWVLSGSAIDGSAFNFSYTHMNPTQLIIQGANAFGDTIPGGDLKLFGGDAQSNADSGSVIIRAGQPGAGVSNRGQIYLDNLPTIAPTSSNAVWNDGGTLKITP